MSRFVGDKGFQCRYYDTWISGRNTAIPILCKFAQCSIDTILLALLLSPIELYVSAYCPWVVNELVNELAGQFWQLMKAILSKKIQ